MSADSISVIIADDHEIFRDGLKLMLSRAPHIKLLGEAANGQQLLELTERLLPDVVITDIKMPELDGIAAARHISRHFPGTGIIALSMFDEDLLVQEMMEAGATSYLLKNSDKQELLEAIEATARHLPYYSGQTSNSLALRLGRLNRESKKAPELNDKEIEIVRLICREFTAKEIAEQVFLSPRTVEGHRLRIMEKLEARNTVGIVVAAIRLGIYNPED